TLVVGESAVPAHLAHGDTLGECSTEEEPGQPEEPEDPGEPGQPGEPVQPEDPENPGAPVKDLLCHVPPGNPSARHEIQVGAPAVPAHLAHGDYLGKCEKNNKKPSGHRHGHGCRH